MDPTGRSPGSGPSSPPPLPSPGGGSPGAGASPPGASHERHPLQSLGHGSLVALIGQVALVAATFGSRVILVRYIPSEYGDLAIGLSIITILNNLGTLGIPNAVARQLAHTQDPKERWAIVSRSLVISSLAATAVCCALVAVAPTLGIYFHDTKNIPLVLDLLSAYLWVSMLSNVVAAYFQGNEDAVPNSLFNQIMAPALTVGCLAALLPHTPSLFTSLLAYIVAESVTLVALVGYTLSRRGYPWRQAAPKGLGDLAVDSSWGGILRFALPLAFVGLASSAVGTADTIVLGLFKASDVVGGYYSVLPLARLVGLAVSALGYIMLPVSSRLHREGDMRGLASSYATITKWMLMASLPFFLIFFFLPVGSLTFVYGGGFFSQPGYGGTTIPLQVTCLGGMVASLCGPSSSVLIGLGKLRWLFFDTAVSAGVDLFVALALAPSLGSLGAAIAFASATALLPVLCVVQTYAAARIHPFTSNVTRPLLLFSVPCVLGLALLTGPLHWAPHGIALVLLFAALFFGYIGSILATRSIELEDAHLLMVVESYLGRRLTLVREFGKRFLQKTPASGPKARP